MSFILGDILHLLQFFPQSGCEEQGKKAGIWYDKGTILWRKNSQSFFLVYVLRAVKPEQMVMLGELGEERQGE